MYFEYNLISFVICKHNSLVGERIKACVCLLKGSIFWINGKPKAAVFPVPVWARATMSVSSSNNSGIAFSCTSDGVSNPKSPIAFNKDSFNPNCSNLFILYF